MQGGLDEQRYTAVSIPERWAGYGSMEPEYKRRENPLPRFMEMLHPNLHQFA
ncbi:hypothetical protein Lsai_0935 [Legionella sainthelensi]|uniref:Uncharacterized protein n=1 Tax=Legionella sainthelensi TaxID=28087 RepID=A0A0W0YN64_9GAMM|nr:hypothetical protein [Legionella sainthelensi]KTD58328.1 hypothetical protein Lsai_0935 [Legionella sainthelensi]VEH27205.1 Uncharacterised protein [Legionella sainthelensi]